MAYEQELLDLAARFPHKLHVHIGYSESLAHEIEAGCDMFMMPSRFEPCGLNQMYSLRYGTPPIVNFTGGLADTVIDVNTETITKRTANGFVFHNGDDEEFLDSIKRALAIYKRPRLWHQLCRTAMKAELGWEASALKYLELYKKEAV